MSLRDTCYLPVFFRPDEMGRQAVPHITRTEDRQRFSSADIDRINACPLNYRAGNIRWKTCYGRPISDNYRRFLVTFAIFLQERDADFVRAVEFYPFLVESTPEPVTARTLRTRSLQADHCGLLSVDRGGEQDGIELANSRQACLYFTSYQKHRLLVANDAVAPTIAGSHRIGADGRALLDAIK
ncbi:MULTISPECIES: hypothetical protein [Rhizobium]|nr:MULTISPECIES: hypothetical protein [Rhizobium]